MGSDLKSHEVGTTHSFGRAMTIRETITNIVARREREVFLVDANTEQEITYGEFHRQACALAAELRARGVRKGDRIGVMLPNCCELAILYFACIYLGAVIVPVNPALSKNEAKFILTSSKCALVVASASNTESIREFHANVVGLITTHGAIENSITSDKIRIGDLSEAGEFVPLETADADDLIVIMYTSGTSAKPKGLAHKLGRMFRNATAFAGAQRIERDFIDRPAIWNEMPGCIRVSTNVRTQYNLPCLTAFDPVAAENCDLDHGMPVRGEGHHAFFNGQGKVDDFHM